MSESEEEQGDKPYDATPRKLENARKKGEFVRSQDVVNLVVLVLFMIGLFAVFNGIMTDVVFRMRGFISQSVSQRGLLNGSSVLQAVAIWILPLLAILFILPFVVLTAGLIGTKQMMFTGEKLQPKLNRISLIANAKKKYGWSGLFEFAKNFAKFSVFAVLMAVFIFDGYALFEMAIVRGEHMALANIYGVAIRWLWLTLIAYVGFAALDLLWQIHDHARKNRMSHKELRDEHKNEEGDENIRQQRRAKAEEIATNRMLLDVPKATVIITNPTHYAVALQWTGEDTTVPKCVARGTDETARKIREIAMQSGVPIYRDPPTARDLYANVKVGMSIESNHYKAVAAAIAYSRRIQEMLRK
jgi:flagellar biosynthetic protein FlhB